MTVEFSFATSIYIYKKWGWSTCKEEAILRRHVPTVAQTVDLLRVL